MYIYIYIYIYIYTYIVIDSGGQVLASASIRMVKIVHPPAEGRMIHNDDCYCCYYYYYYYCLSYYYTCYNVCDIM